TQLILERVDLPGRGRLSHIQTGGCRCYAAAVRDRYKGAKVPQVHVGNIRISHHKLNNKFIGHMNCRPSSVPVAVSIGGTAMTGFRSEMPAVAMTSVASSIGILGTLAPLLFAFPARAETWPARALTMVAPGAAGSSVDVVARIFSPPLSEALGRQVIVEDMGGAGGMNAAARVAKA